MAPRQIIEDSDEDEDAIEVPEEEFPSGVLPIASSSATDIEQAALNQQLLRNATSSSTDSAFFQAIYDAQLAELQVSTDKTGNQSDIHDNREQNTGSGISSAVNDQGSYSKSGLNGSVNSLSELYAAIQEKKRAESVRDPEMRHLVSDLEISKDVPQVDIWEFPSSDDLDTNAVAKTKANRKRVNHEDNPANLPAPKRLRRGPIVNGDSPNGLSENSKIQVLRSASEEAHFLLGHSVSRSKADSFQPVDSTIETSVVNETELSTVSLEKDVSNGSKASMVVIENTLTSSQRQQYKVVDVTSDHGEDKSFQHIMESSNIVLKYTGDSSTIPNETPFRQRSSASEALNGDVELSSSPPLSSASRRRKRANSVTEQNVTTEFSRPGRNTKSKRSKSIPLGDRIGSQDSADELSLHSLPSAGGGKEKSKSHASKRDKRKEVDDDRVDIDELFGSDDIGLPRERYQPRHSSRRSKSLSVDVQAPATRPEHVPERSTRRRAGRRNEKEVAQVVEEESSRSVLQEKDIESTNIEAADAVVVKREEDVVLTLPTKRKRGRPKKSQEAKAKEDEDLVLETVETPPEPLQQDSTEERDHVLQDSDPNKQMPSQKNTGLDQTEESISTSFEAEDTLRTPPLQTPTKTNSNAQSESQSPTRKGPDQHSPLQSGKVPYRVGLSRRTRIAPLLKIIRK